MNLADMGAGAEGAEAVFGFNTFMRSGGNVVGDLPSDFDSVKLSYNAGVAYQFAVTVDSGNLVTNSAEMILNSVVYEATAETNVYNNDLFLPLLNK